MTALVLDQVVKRFGDFTAVDDLSFSVPDGGVFGFLGGNGAGKTTSVRMMLDILRPDAGRIEVLGRAPSRANAPQVGFLPEERGLYRLMTVVDTVIYFGRLKGMAAADAGRSAGALIERLGLSQWARDHPRQALQGHVAESPACHRAGESPAPADPGRAVLGPRSRQPGRAGGNRAGDGRSGGATVIFSTHVMQHAERLSDRLLLLARGRKVFEGTQAEARAQLPPRLLLTAQADPAHLPGVARAVAAGKPRERLAAMGRHPGAGPRARRPAAALHRQWLCPARLRPSPAQPA